MLSSLGPRLQGWLRQPNAPLRRRLLFAAAALLLLFLSITGVVLDGAFRASIDDSARAQLRLRVLNLLSVAEWRDGALVLPPALSEARYNRPGSGLYARLFDGGTGLAWQSLSLSHSGVSLPAPLPMPPGGEAFDRIATAEGAPLYRFTFGLLWEGPEGDVPYRLEVSFSQQPFQQEARGFRRSLWLWLGGATVALLLLQMALLRAALAPLGRMAKAVEALERGEEGTLARPWPLELSGLAKNLEALLASERARQKRYRTTLDDLAHSLKTPLAILRNTRPEDEGERSTQLSRMESIVAHHLKRASLGTNPLTSDAVPLASHGERLLAGLRRLHADRGLTLTADLDPTLAVAVDERDLYDILGNLLDNACKYGHSRVHLRAEGTADAVKLWVEDDGPGIPEALHGYVLTRGARADTAQQGQGIGLAMVTERVASYGGALAIGTSAFGGAAVGVTLPRASRPAPEARA